MSIGAHKTDADLLTWGEELEQILEEGSHTRCLRPEFWTKTWVTLALGHSPCPGCALEFMEV